MDYIGLDVHKNQTQICILDEEGKVLKEQRILTQRERFAEVFGEKPRSKLLLEASTEAEWVTRCLEDLGQEVIVADPNYAPM